MSEQAAKELERAQHKAMMCHQPDVDLSALLKWAEEAGSDDWRAQDMRDELARRKATNKWLDRDFIWHPGQAVISDADVAARLAEMKATYSQGGK